MATIRSLATPLQFPPNFPEELNYSVSCSPALTIKSGSRTAAALRLLVHLLQVSRADTEPASTMPSCLKYWNLVRRSLL